MNYDAKSPIPVYTHAISLKQVKCNISEAINETQTKQCLVYQKSNTGTHTCNLA